MTVLQLFSLNGKTALVTGCKRGIGKAMAVGLAEAGADIIGVSATLEASGSAVEKDVTALGRSFQRLRLRFCRPAGAIQVHRAGQNRFSHHRYSGEQRRHYSAQTGGGPLPMNIGTKSST